MRNLARSFPTGIVRFGRHCEQHAADLFCGRTCAMVIAVLRESTDLLPTAVMTKSPRYFAFSNLPVAPCSRWIGLASSGGLVPPCWVRSISPILVLYRNMVLMARLTKPTRARMGCDAVSRR